MALHRFLDPSERMSELLFGLIMTLTFTLGASLVIQEGPDATRELLAGVVGCNVAWGIIDGLLYVMTAMYERGRVHRAATVLRRDGESAAAEMVRAELEEGYGQALSAATTSRVVAELVQALRTANTGRVRIQSGDLGGAAGCFVMVVATSVPAVLPFLFLDNHLLALRVSNALLLALIFAVGYVWARLTNANPWMTGTGMALFGMVLVQLTIMLGG